MERSIRYLQYNKVCVLQTIEEGWHGNEANTDSFKRAVIWILRCQQATHTYWSHALTKHCECLNHNISA